MRNREEIESTLPEESVTIGGMTIKRDWVLIAELLLDIRGLLEALVDIEIINNQQEG